MTLLHHDRLRDSLLLVNPSRAPPPGLCRSFLRLRTGGARSRSTTASSPSTSSPWPPRKEGMLRTLTCPHTAGSWLCKRRLPSASEYVPASGLSRINLLKTADPVHAVPIPGVGPGVQREATQPPTLWAAHRAGSAGPGDCRGAQTRASESTPCTIPPSQFLCLRSWHRMHLKGSVGH